MAKEIVMGFRVTYGIGGYDPTKPDNNIVEIVDEDTLLPALPEPPTDPDETV
jgi:hypothetical protein